MIQNLDLSKGINSSELRGFLTGLILGDGYIDKGVRKRSFSIKSINKEFIDYISKCLDKVTNFQWFVRHKPAYYAAGCAHKESWEFVVKAHPYFSKIFHYFYDDRRHRKIQSKTLSWLTPRGLANWYMSDGYVCLVGKTKGTIIDRRVDICTDRYFKEDVILMTTLLKKKFNIDASIIRRNCTYRLRINKSSYEDFFNLISPYVVPSMYYKMYLGYENKPSTFSDEFWEFQQSLISATTQTDNAVG